MDIVVNNKPVRVPVLPAAAGVLLVLLLFTTLRVGSVKPDQFGVFVNKLSGEVTIDQQPGAKPYIGWIKDFYTLDKAVQTYQMSKSEGDQVVVRTRDGAEVEIDVTINYRLTDDSNLIATRVVPECGLNDVPDPKRQELVNAYKLKWVRDYARSVIRDKFGELAPREFYEDAALRTQKQNASRDELRTLLEPHGIELIEVVLQRYDFDDAFEQIINKKKAAEQDVQKQAALAAAALEEQKREIAKAEAEQNRKLAEIQGELDGQVLAMEGEAKKSTEQAEAYRYKTEAQADADFYRAKNTAQQVLVAAQTEAEGLARLADALSGSGATQLVRMAYAEALRKAQLNGVPYATDPRIQRVELKQEGGQR